MLVVLGLGSNLGDSCAIIQKAVEALGSVLSQLRRASLYETAPLHVLDQGSFINTAVAGFCEAAPARLLDIIHSIEDDFGRNRSLERRWGERTLDIDILLFGDLLLNEPDLTIPHVMLKKRRFALEPLLEVYPDAVEPGTGLSYREICDLLPNQGVKKYAYMQLILPERVKKR